MAWRVSSNLRGAISMDFESLLSMIGIESPAELSFFEQYADIVEGEGEIERDALLRLFAEARPESLAELTHDYFGELLDVVPDEETEFYVLLDAIGTNLSRLAEDMGAAGNLDLYTEEFARFRRWYMSDSEVLCISDGDGSEGLAPISEALTLCRLQRMGEGEYRFDFSACMDYPLEEYVWRLRPDANS
jgi:hypothetical protein